jgi:hypothetical protein
MSILSKATALQVVFTYLKRIKTRTWVILGCVSALLFAVAIYAAIALFGMLWGGAKTLVGAAPSLDSARAELSKHTDALAGAARAALDTHLPEHANVTTAVDAASRELAGQVNVLTQAASDALTQTAPVAGAAALAILGNERATPGKNLPAEALPPRDVSGEDLGPARFAGLTRTAWHRAPVGSITGAANAVVGATVRYEGALDYVSVLNHYQRQFATLGYSQTVISATQNAETLRFSHGDSTLDFTIERATIQQSGGAPVAGVVVQISSAP